MEYMSVKEASKAWAVSSRCVQLYCKKGMIQDVKMVGTEWLIPACAQRPQDLRKTIDYLPSMSILNNYSVLELDSSIKSMPKAEALVASAELAYFRGEIGEGSKLFYSTKTVDRLRIPILNIVCYDSSAAGNVKLYCKALKELKVISRNNKVERAARQSAELSHLFHSYEGNKEVYEIDAEKAEDSVLAIKKNVLLTNAYCSFLKYDFEKAKTIAESVLLVANKKSYSVVDINFLILCGGAHFAMGNIQKAEEYAGKAVELAMPVGIILPFAEAIAFSGNFAINFLEKKSLDFANKVVNLGKTLLKNLAQIYNLSRKSKIPPDFSDNDWGIGFYVGSDFTNVEIAEKLDLSLSYVKKRLEYIYEYFGLSGRNALKDSIREYIYKDYKS